MSVIRIMTNFNIDLEFPAAPFHRRLLALLIDTVVLCIYVAVINALAGSLMGAGANLMVAIYIFVLFIPLVTYHLICEVTMNGQSFGKKIMGIRVVNENGGQPAISQFIIRWLIRTADIAVVTIVIELPSAVRTGNIERIWEMIIPILLFLTDVLLVNLSKKNQRLGDILAHTLLIKVGDKHTIHDTVFLQLEDNYRPSFPQVMQLSDKDINSLKGILDTARRRHDYGLAEMASEKIRKHLKIETTLSPFDFLEVLMKDYNYLSAN